MKFKFADGTGVHIWVIGVKSSYPWKNASAIFLHSAFGALSKYLAAALSPCLAMSARQVRACSVCNRSRNNVQWNGNALIWEWIHGTLQLIGLLHTYLVLIAWVHFFSSSITTLLSLGMWHITLGFWFINGYNYRDKYRGDRGAKLRSSRASSLRHHLQECADEIWFSYKQTRLLLRTLPSC